VKGWGLLLNKEADRILSHSQHRPITGFKQQIDPKISKQKQDKWEMLTFQEKERQVIP